jgi:tol-pal system protein YbgF
MKKVILAALLAFTCTAWAGTKEDIEQVQRNLLELQQQFWNLEKDLKANTTDFKDTAGKLQKTNDELRQSQAALNAKLETILNQIQALNAKLDETNVRIRELAAAGNRLGTTGAYEPVQTEPQGSQHVEESPEPMENTEQSGQAPLPAGQGSVGEQQIFTIARAEYTKGNFEQALRGFQDMLDQYPNSAIADDAQFMIGESYYGMKEYVDAVAEYDKVVKRFPDSPNVPGAQLKKAFSLFALGKKGQGVVELQQISQRYPNTKEAQIARQRLAELGLD